MIITAEFLAAEIRDLKVEADKARTFVVQADATISAYEMLLRRLDAPEPQIQEVQNDS